MFIFKTISKYKHALSLFFIVVYGAFLRVYDIGKQSLWIDEGFTMMQEKSIFEHGYPLLMSGNIEYKDVLFPYILSGLRFLAGENIQSFRLVAVFFGIASILVIYFLAKAYFNKNIALFSAFLLSFSYWHIAWSRQIRSYSLFVFLFLLAQLFYLYYEKSQNKKWLLLLLITLCFAILAKSNIGVIVTISFLIFIFYRKKRVPYYIYSLFAALIGSFIALNYNFLIKIFSPFHQNYLKYYVVDYLWQFYGLFFVLAAVGAYLHLKNNHQQEKQLTKLNILIFISSITFFAFFSLINQRRYLFFISPLIFIYASYCINFLTKEKTRLTFLFFTLILLINQISFVSITFKPSAHYFLETYTPQPDFSAAYEHITHSNENSIIISAYPFLDYIYLGKSDFALPISYSGLPNDSALLFSTEYYTNSQRLFTPSQILEIAGDSSVLIILDDMSISRSDKSMVKFIQKNAALVFENKNQVGQNIFIYKMLQQKNP